MNKLEILIPCHERHVEKLKSLAKIIDAQSQELVAGSVTIGVLYNSGGKTHGEFRQELIEKCEAEYCWHVDADDEIDPDAIARVMVTLESSPDAVGFFSDRYINGRFMGFAEYSDCFPHDSSLANGETFIYERVINCRCVVRTSIARKIGFRPLPTSTNPLGEDTDFGRRLKKSGLLKKVVTLPMPPIYKYLQVKGK